MTLSNLNKNLNNFKIYNDIKIKNTLNISPKNFKIIFKILPFLLHTNCKNLPGFIDGKNCPCGIKYYKIEQNLINLVVSAFKLNNLKINEAKENFIEFISVMGSIGSIAQTNKSDYDIWIGINRKKCNDEAYNLFLKKLFLIEHWCLKQNIEVHFFPSDIEKIKNNNFGTLDEESCGSAQGLILKDEFMRSSIIIAGKISFWWAIDSNLNNIEYSSFYDEYKKTKDNYDYNLINLGNISSLNKNEFLGASLWQLVKSLKFPVKSFIKMNLIEYYIYGNSSNNINLLSNSLKENIFNKKLDDNHIDSYLLMYKTIERYLLKTEQIDKLNFLQKCLYLKSKPNLSNITAYELENNKKSIVMKNYCSDWKWDKNKIMNLDNFEKWPFNKILEFNESLKNFMLNSFSFITKDTDIFSNKNLMTENDYKIITGKLKSYFSVKPNKIKYFYFTMEDSIYERELSIIKKDLWHLYRGKPIRNKNKLEFSGLLYTSKNITDLCLWLAYNKIYNRYLTKLFIFDKNISFNNVRDLIENIGYHFHTHHNLILNDYLKRPYIVKATVVFNFLPSNKNDYISLFYLTSWNELFSFHFKEIDDFLISFNKIISDWELIHNDKLENFIYFYNSQGQLAEFAKLKKILLDVLQKIKMDSTVCFMNKLFITQLNQKYLFFYNNCKETVYVFKKNIFDLLNSISELKTNNNFTLFYFNLTENEKNIVTFILENMNIEQNEVFYTKLNEDYYLLLVSDINNSIYYDITPKDFYLILSQKYTQFMSDCETIEVLNLSNKYILKKTDINSKVNHINNIFFTIDILVEYKNTSIENINLDDCFFKIENIEFKLNTKNGILEFLKLHKNIETKKYIFYNITDIKSFKLTLIEKLKLKIFLEKNILKILKREISDINNVLN